MTGDVEFIGVLSNSSKKKEQKWKRIPLPDDYITKRKKEISRQNDDPDYFDPYLESVRQQEWKRRLCGVWVMINGKATYLPGSFYYYLNWCPLDIGYAQYRDTDKRLFYVWEYCTEDPRCAGLVEIERRRMGKCFAKDTLIRMYDGSTKKVQDIEEGEYVMGNDSSSRLVYGKTSGVELMYRISPNKGKPFECNESHILSLIWNGGSKVHSVYGWKPGDTVNISVRDYLKLKFWEKDHLVLYRAGWGDEFKEQDHFITPYILGVFLGDGCATNGNITSADSEILNAYTEFIDPLGLELKHRGQYDYQIVQKQYNPNTSIEVDVDGETLAFETIVSAKKHFGERESVGSLSKTKFNKRYDVRVINRGQQINVYTKALKDIDVLKNKHIPQSYLIDSRENRLQLLAGLLDTDGHLHRNLRGTSSCFEIVQKNKRLAFEIVELSRSLGFYTNISPKIARMKRKDGSIYSCEVWRIHIFGKIQDIPCRLPRKQAFDSNPRVNSMHSGFKVEPIGDGEYFGFAVDDNHLFLLADGTVVHNTYKSGSILLERASRMKYHHGGIQSKTSGDAKQVFQKTVVSFFKKMPDFYRPIYDQAGGVTPTSALRFFQTTIKGRKSNTILTGEELESWIDFGSSDLFFYDGSKLQTYVMDEFGKTKDVSVWDRWNIVRFCLDQDGQWVGKGLCTSTIEELEAGGKEAKKLWDASDPNKRDANGRTQSGLYQFFLPAFETTYFDDYGMPDTKKAMEYYLAQREGLKDDPYALSSIIRKNPFTISEAFRVDGDMCLFDAIKLNDQRDYCSWNRDLTERGNFEWADGVKDSKVIWVPSKTGRWEILRGFNPNPGEVNNTIKRGSVFYPANKHRFGSGCDPFDHRKTEDDRRSMGASLVKQKSNIFNFADPYIGSYVCKYLARPQTPDIFYEDMIKQCFYFSCEILVENNKPGIIYYFERRGYKPFLMHLKGKKEPGIASSQEAKDLAMDFLTDQIDKNVSKVFFMDVIEDWLNFDITETQKYDLAMASLWTEVACTNKYKLHQVPEDKKDITHYFKLRKISSLS